MAFALAAKSSACAQLNKRAAKSCTTPRVSVVVRAAQSEETAVNTRRATLGLLAGAAALVSRVDISEAAYGDSANIFGKVTNKSGYVNYSGDGFAMTMPARWYPSKERDFGGPNKVELRYEDSFDQVTNVVILSQPTSNSSIDQFGSPDKFLENFSYLLGKQAFAGQTISEGGFKPNRVSAASLLDVKTDTDKKGKKYYKYDILVRTADNDEGGRHQLINATVGNGKLYIMKIQVGDKRWFRGTKKEAISLFDSFTVA